MCKLIKLYSRRGSMWDNFVSYYTEDILLTQAQIAQESRIRSDEMSILPSILSLTAQGKFKNRGSTQQSFPGILFQAFDERQLKGVKSNPSKRHPN